MIVRPGFLARELQLAQQRTHAALRTAIRDSLAIFQKPNEVLASARARLTASSDVIAAEIRQRGSTPEHAARQAEIQAHLRDLDALEDEFAARAAFPTIELPDF